MGGWGRKGRARAKTGRAGGKAGLRVGVAVGASVGVDAGGGRPVREALCGSEKRKKKRKKSLPGRCSKLMEQKRRQASEEC